MNRTFQLLSAIGLIIALGIGSAASAQSDSGTMTVIHGVPGLTVDVYVNGDLTLEGFEPGAITDPLELEAGSYQIDIRAAGEDPESDPALSGSAVVTAGINATIIAHLTADGTPSLAVFANDVSTIPGGETRLTVRHAAAAPEVDIWVDGDVVVESLANGAEASLGVPAASYNVAASAAGDTEPVLGPADFELAEGTAYQVYAIGSLEDGSLDLLVQTIPGLHDAPQTVPAGIGSTAAESSGISLLFVIAIIGSVLLFGSMLGMKLRTR